MNVIDFVAYVEQKKARELAIQSAYEAEMARRAQLETFLTDLLSELEAA